MTATEIKPLKCVQYEIKQYMHVKRKGTSGKGLDDLNSEDERNSDPSSIEQGTGPLKPFSNR